MAEDWEDVPVSTGEGIKDVTHVGEAQVVPSQLPTVQRRTAFQTAVAVIRSRNLKQVEQDILMESESAGEEFFYSIPFRKKDGSVENVRDGSIDLAYAFMRAMGNCGITSDIKDIVAPDGHHWEFTATFIDLEKGANYERTVRRQAGAGTLGGLAKKDPQRVYDMRFGAAQSIAHRNAIKAGVPGWLWKRAVQKSIDAATAAIRKETPAVAIEKAVKHFTGMGVTLEMMEKALGVVKAEWKDEEILKLRGYATAIKDGMSSSEGIFGRAGLEPEKGPPTPGAESEGQPEQPKAAPGGKKREKAEKPKVSADTPAPTTGGVETGPSAQPGETSGPVEGEAKPQVSNGQPGITFPDLMKSLQDNPGLQFSEGTMVKSSQVGIPPLAQIMGVEWTDDGACCVRLKFASNLGELVHGLTKADVIASFKEAGIYVEDVVGEEPAPAAKKQGRPTAADVRAECRDILAANSIAWEEAGRFFPGASLDDCPDASLSGLLSWLKSRAGG